MKQSVNHIRWNVGKLLWSLTHWWLGSVTWFACIDFFMFIMMKIRKSKCLIKFFLGNLSQGKINIGLIRPKMTKIYGLSVFYHLTAVSCIKWQFSAKIQVSPSRLRYSTSTGNDRSANTGSSKMVGQTWKIDYLRILHW